MSILLDHQFREQISHTHAGFPISYFHDELAGLPEWTGPLHWHPEFEIATSQDSVLDFQIGPEHLTLDPGDSVFIHGNIPHRIRQPQGSRPDPMPNIVFDGTLLASQDSLIHQRYIQPVKACDTLPNVLFRDADPDCAPVQAAIREIYRLLRDTPPCFELSVQRGLGIVFEYLALHFDSLPKVEASHIQLSTQIRIQQMLTFLYAHYAEDITLDDISQAAHISRSEAGRCFRAYMGCSPVDALIRYRLQMAHGMLQDPAMPLIEICLACGFHSVHYFSRQFRRYYGCSPSQARILGKSCSSVKG